MNHIGLLRAALAAALAFGLVAAAGAPATAHTGFVGSDPTEGSTGDAPAEVVLEFSGALLDIGMTIEVLDGDGVDHSEGAAGTRGDRFAVQALQPLPAGEYTVDWRVVSEDGHPIEGEYTFTVSGGDAPEPSASPTAAASDEPTDAAPTAGPPALDSDSGGILSADSWVWRGGVIVAVLIVVFRLAIVRFISRQR